MKLTITSSQNPKIKEAVRLRESRARRKTGLIVIDGIREVRSALDAQVGVETVFIPEDDISLLDSLGPRAAMGDIRSALQPVTRAVFEKLCYGERDSRVVAIARQPTTDLAGLVLPPLPLVVVLDQAEKPGNVGAVVRTASAAGVDAVILCHPTCEIFNPNAIRASLGTLFSVPIASAGFSELSEWFQQQGLGVWRACVDKEARSLWLSDFRGPVALVFGSEALGLGTEWNRADWPAFTIPMFGSADSLNLSNSASIVCYEAVRQRAKGTFDTTK